MTRQSILAAVSALCLAFLMACAAPEATVPPSGGGPVTVTPAPPPSPPAVTLPPSGPRLPPPAEEPESYALVRDDPAVAAATAALAAAPPAERPAALMRRARAAFDAARRLHTGRGGPSAAVWPPGDERFAAFCELALRDLNELLAAHPRASEAPEAMFSVGRIHDYPNLNLFDEALAAYRLTVERYPGTSWARLASERIAVIERIVDVGKGSTHGTPGPGQEPKR